MARNDSGLLIVFEGIDGAGKTTQVEFLRQHFFVANLPVVTSKEPTDGPWGQKIRKSASSGRLPLAEEIEAFLEDRKQHVRELIGPALSAGKIVILDRYFYSTIAYQGSRGGNVDKLTMMMQESAPIPDAVIFLDVPSEIGLARVREGRGEIPNAFEKESTLRKVREIFLVLAETQPNFIKISGTDSVEVVRKNIFTSLSEGILKHRLCSK